MRIIKANKMFLKECSLVWKVMNVLSFIDSLPFTRTYKSFWHFMTLRQIIILQLVDVRK